MRTSWTAASRRPRSSPESHKELPARVPVAMVKKHITALKYLAAQRLRSCPSPAPSANEDPGSWQRSGWASTSPATKDSTVALIINRAYGFPRADAALALIVVTLGPINHVLPHERGPDPGPYRRLSRQDDVPRVLRALRGSPEPGTLLREVSGRPGLLLGSGPVAAAHEADEGDDARAEGEEPGEEAL